MTPLEGIVLSVNWEAIGGITGVAALIVTVIFAPWEKVRLWLRRKGESIRNRIHAWTAPPSEEHALYVTRQQTIGRIREEVFVDLRSNKPFIVANESGVTRIYIWPVIDNFSLSELKVTNFDVRLQVGQFTTEKSGTALGEKIPAQGRKELMVRISLNDAEVPALQPYPRDNILRDMPTINVFGRLESLIGDVHLNQVFQRTNEYVGL